MSEAADGRIPARRALALGMVQGPAELLPVSSSAHIVLVPWLAGWDWETIDPEVRKSFEVALHAGAAAALLMPAISSANATFSLTVLFGRSLKSWNTTPRSMPWPVTGWPPIRISPAAGAKKPAMVLSSVDLPQPEGPTSTMNSPSRISRLIPSIALRGASGRRSILSRAEVVRPALGSCTKRPTPSGRSAATPGPSQEANPLRSAAAPACCT